MDKPVLYLFVGYPGAGKTTAARLIQEKTGAVHLWADRERLKLFKRPTHSWEESKALYAQLNEATEYLLGQGKSVIFDTNFNFRKDRDRLRAIAKKYGADAVVIWINTPKTVARHRALDITVGEKPDTRLYGDMTIADFERIANHLEPPAKDEKMIKIDGTKLDGQELMRQLGL